MAASFLFYDLETFGTDPRRTRIAQFAAIRTDADLNPVDEPWDFMVKPADDLLPSPTASLITGIAPQRALRDGMPEAEAFARIFEAMSVPETCTLGYNSLRFDDEFVRHGLFRNFFDPYEREWRGGNSRWDLLDVMRLAHALRPEGIVWPLREDGAPSFKLEHLAEANGVREGDAHEALSDVRALIGMARKLKRAQPKLWDYAMKLRDKKFAARMLDTVAMTPVLHVSQRFPAARLCAAAVVPLARHPKIDNRVIVFDLHEAPDALLALDAGEIADRLYTPAADLPPGEARIPLKEVHLNRSPMLIEWAHLREADFERLRIDPAQVEERAERLREAGPALAEKIRRIYADRADFEPGDVDASLYDAFLQDADRRKFPDVRGTPPPALAQRDFAFQDARLPELLFRYRARNWPDTLSPAERDRWNAYRRGRLCEDRGLSEFTFDSHRSELAALRAAHAGDGRAMALLDQAQAWADALETDLA
ncbi:exodeoxyribonuclease I [Lysobacter hankyongensis]|uniref:Exodeoxyribonuclease I n=1 Tax=Lysobacter hankyongensis TaxID=1176535 RepID=A0ABP9BT83_9GAMM